MSNELAIAPKRTESELALQQMNQEQIELLKRTVCKGATNDELALFVHVCNRTGLDPFAKQIHAVKRKGVMTIQTGIDGYRLIAARTKEYEGQGAPEWCGGDGKWIDVWLSKEPPAAARVRVYRTGFREPAVGIATYSTYVQHKSDGGVNVFWKKMAPEMLAKCAEALALRKAFPADLSGIYAEEEMLQAGNDPDAPLVPLPQRVSDSKPEPEEEAEDAALVVSGVIDDVTVAKGETNGKKWTRYDVHLNDTRFATFSETLATAAKEMKEAGVVVSLEYKEGQHGNTLIDMIEEPTE